MLEQGLFMLAARRAVCDVAAEKQSDRGVLKTLQENARQWTTFWHKSLLMSGSEIPLVSHLVRARLNRTEREILLVLLMKHLALLPLRIENCEDVLEQIVNTPMERLKAVRSLNEGSRLVRHGLVALDTDEELPSKRALYLDPMLAEMAMNPMSTPASGWPVVSEEALYDYMHRLAHAFQQKAEQMQRIHRGYGDKSEAYKWRRNVDNLLKGLNNTLQQHPGWKLAGAHKAIGGPRNVNKEQWRIFLALLCKELGHVSADDELFQGIGLLRAACTGELVAHKSQVVLGTSAFLRAQEWIQPCGGAGNFMSDDRYDLEETEYELTKKSLDFLGLSGKKAQKRKSQHELLKPTITFADLVLSSETTEHLKRAAAQALHAGVMFKDWGLGASLSYGRGVTLMFHGPPGTGKTAAAQALAHTLGKPLLIADYSRIQNCFVGQTEKNIVRIFNEAVERDAVLFWDEADAMFFDRDSAQQSWEVRDTNMLLQELERFDGICVLATNRVTALDKALERRISLKVTFDRPDKQARLEIFRRMIPKKMPLADDVNITDLAENDLSGGEIKNVIMNAARSALARDGEKATVCMEDFRGAIRSVIQGAWSRKHGREIGFNT